MVVLSHGLWQRRFAGDPNIIGRLITLEQKPYTVAGVLPVGFTYPEKTDAWVPLTIDAKLQTERMHWTYFMLAKLRSGVLFKNAQAEMDAIAAETARRYPKDASGIKFSLVTLQQTAVGNGQTELLALSGAVGFLLLTTATGDCRARGPGRKPPQDCAPVVD